MKRSRSAEEQIIGILRENEAGAAANLTALVSHGRELAKEKASRPCGREAQVFNALDLK